MKNTFFLLMMGSCLLLCQAGFSQSMSNTGNTITLTNTCLSATNGSYTLSLEYVDPDNGSTTVTVPCAVAAGGGVITITVAGTTLPTPATDGSWSLPDADNGFISLTGGPHNGILIWYHNPDGTWAMECTALPVVFANFTGGQSSGTVHLTWQTETESNSTWIEIYRSSTGAVNSYYKIGQVQGAINSVSTLNYSFTDLNPDAQNHYYLKLLNSQGTPAVTSFISSVNCSGCTYTPPTPVNCSYTINGPDHICAEENFAAYTLSSSVPDYNTIVWSVDQPSAVHLATYPAFDRTQATLLKRGVAGGVTLTATLSGCSNSISRTVALGTPDPGINAYTDCPFLHADAIGTAAATNYEWHVEDVNTGTSHVTNTPSSSWSANIINGHTYNIWFVYTNGCGTSNAAGDYGVSCGFSIPPEPQSLSSGSLQSTLSVSPNPASGVVRINTPSKVYQVRVVSAQGMVRKSFSYPSGADNVTVDLSSLPGGIYTIQVFDKKTWKSSQLLLTK